MRKLPPRRAGLGLGLAMLVGLVAYPLATCPARANAPSRHNRIHFAIDALLQAKAEIEEAQHDWGGDKKDALESIDRSIEHLRKLDEYRE